MEIVKSEMAFVKSLNYVRGFSKMHCALLDYCHKLNNCIINRKMVEAIADMVRNKQSELKKENPKWKEMNISVIRYTTQQCIALYLDSYPTLRIDFANEIIDNNKQ